MFYDCIPNVLVNLKIVFLLYEILTVAQVMLEYFSILFFARFTLKKVECIFGIKIFIYCVTSTLSSTLILKSLIK